jgi:single-stranded-DNA-specific exonuclease
LEGVSIGGPSGDMDFSEAKALLLLDAPSTCRQWDRFWLHFNRLERIYCSFPGGDAFRRQSYALLDREQFGLMYRQLQRLSTTGSDTALAHLARSTGLSTPMIRFILDVFKELGFVEEEGNALRIVTAPDKRGLEESQLYRREQDHRILHEKLVSSTSKELSEFILKLIQPVTQLKEEI